jgi:hypothetical protein
MVFIENDVSSSSAQEEKKKCVFFCNKTEILGVGIAAGVLVIALILAFTGCFFLKQKPSAEKDAEVQKAREKYKIDEEKFAVSGSEII